MKAVFFIRMTIYSTDVIFSLIKFNQLWANHRQETGKILTISILTLVEGCPAKSLDGFPS